MKFFRKICILVLIIVISITTCLVSSCDALKREVISEEKAKDIVTEYFDNIKAYIENTEYSLDFKRLTTPTLQLYGDETPRSVCSELYFNGNDSFFNIKIYLKLTEKRVRISTSLYTNHDSLENNQVSNDLQTIIMLQNLVSERQFTADEYVDFLMQDKYILKWNESVVQHRCNFFDFEGDISFYYFENKEYDNELKGVHPISNSRYEHLIKSLSKKTV